MKNIMIRIVLLLCFAAVISFALTGCGSEYADPGEYIDLKTATETYSVKDAKAAGYVIIVDSQVTAGEQIWQNFVRHTRLGKPSRVRIVHSDSMDRIASSYAVPDAYSYITEVEYDGDKYISRSYHEGELYQAEYKYMLRFAGEPESPYAEYERYVSYVLVNDDTVTHEQIWKSVLSSASGAYIPHDEVYTNLTPHKL